MKYDSQSLSFISGVSSLEAGLDSTPMEPRKNTSITLLLESLVNTLSELLASPLCAGSLSLLFPYSFFIFSKFSHFCFLIFFHFSKLCIALIHFRGGRGIPAY